MLGLNNILGESQDVKGLGDVFPVNLAEYESFMENVFFLRITKKHFEQEDDELSLFEMVAVYAYQTETVDNFIKMLKIITKEDFTFSFGEEIGFSSGGRYLDKTNFDEFRQIVMDQNLLYEDRVFKNPMVKRWADKVLETRNKDSIDMSLEDIVSVVHVFTGIPYAEIAKYTLFQLKHTFQRILKIEDQRQAIQFKIAGAEDQKIAPFMERIELNKDPYDDVFVSKDKLSNIRKIF